MNINNTDAIQGPENIPSLLPDDIEVPDTLYDILNSSILYQSSTYSGSNNPLIELSYENGPYVFQDEDVHFRLSFYQDSFMEILLYTSFSVSDNGRWFIAPTNDGANKASSFSPQPINDDGLTVPAGESRSVYFAPDILPANLYLNQIKNSTNDKYSLECGVSYYVKAEYYVNGHFYFINNFIYKVRCQKIRSEFDDDNIEGNNWSSDANGVGDILISRNEGPSVLPSIINSSRDKSIFYVAWRNFSFKNAEPGDYDGNNNFAYSNDYYLNKPVMSYGYWDATNDIWHFSGQMSYDWTKGVGVGHNITLLHDIYGNIGGVDAFNSGRNSNICVYTNNVFKEETSSNVNNLTNLLRDNVISYNNIYPYVRVAEKYISSVSQISQDISIPVIETKLIELEIEGISDVRAIRLKNEDSSEWSQWISVDNNLSSDIKNENDDLSAVTGKYDINYGEYNSNDVFKAVSFSDSKIICPWSVSGGNGVKSVWVQQLSPSGLTQISLLNIISNVQEVSYSVEINNGLSYKGNGIIKSGNNNIKISILNFDSYIKEFSFMLEYNKYNNLLDSTGENIYEQIADNSFVILSQNGLEIKRSNLSVSNGTLGIFGANISIGYEDKIYLRDGNATLSILIPTMNNLEDIQKENDSSYNLETKFITTMTPLKRYYNGDDELFIFGNEKYWSNS